MDSGQDAKASQTQALEAMATALRALKDAKKAGADVKPYRPRMKDCLRAFEAGDYAAAIAMADQVLLEVADLPRRS